MTRTQFWVRTTMLLTLAGAAGGGALAYVRGHDETPTVTTTVVTRGDIAESVSATGTIEALTRVEVGTQVSGSVKELLADFNGFVQQGQVLARLDPALFASQVEQARAGVIRAQADVERLRVTLADTQAKLERSTQLASKNLIAATDLEAAEVAVRLAAAQVTSAEAGVRLAQASLSQAQVNLDHTIITAPIDGVVISRNVDVGQTVAASMSAPTLFVLAADLTRMQVSASLDESDVGRVEAGQPATFRVDAYPDQVFAGTVTQVRLQPVVTQNVVTYETIVECDNPGLRLKPGMTASVTIEVARATDTLLVPGTALRFTPSADVAAAFGLTTTPARTVGARSAGQPGAATLWTYAAGRLTPVTVTTGISNGTLTAIDAGAVAAGTPVVIAVATAPGAGSASATTRSPLMATPGPPPR